MVLARNFPVVDCIDTLQRESFIALVQYFITFYGNFSPWVMKPSYNAWHLETVCTFSIPSEPMNGRRGSWISNKTVDFKTCTLRVRPNRWSILKKRAVVHWQIQSWNDLVRWRWNEKVIYTYTKTWTVCHSCWTQSPPQKHQAEYRPI